MTALMQRFINLTGFKPRPLARFCAVVSFTAWAAAPHTEFPPAWLIVLVVAWYGCIFGASGHEMFRMEFNSATRFSRMLVVVLAALYSVNELDLWAVKWWFEAFALYLLTVKDPPPPRRRVTKLGLQP